MGLSRDDGAHYRERSVALRRGSRVLRWRRLRGLSGAVRWGLCGTGIIGGVRLEILELGWGVIHANRVDGGSGVRLGVDARRVHELLKGRRG